MKWIKYQILCNENESILLNKKVGYSDENLAIAQAEAFDNKIEIIEDDKNFEELPAVVPAPKAEDEGKFLRVVGGAITWVTIKAAEGGSY